MGPALIRPASIPAPPLQVGGMTKAFPVRRRSLCISANRRRIFTRASIWSPNRPSPLANPGFPLRLVTIPFSPKTQTMFRPYSAITWIESGNVVRSNIDARKDSQPRGSHFDGARMPYAMFFRGGYAMHQGYVPPFAASHGCIRLPRGMARPFFENASVGTPGNRNRVSSRKPTAFNEGRRHSLCGCHFRLTG